MAKHKVSCLLTSWAAVMLLFCFCRTGKSQDFSECGVSMGIRAKVIGGRKSHPGQWPWQVAINKTKYGAANKETQFHCGGALIDKRWVLTAAHCFYQLVYSWTSRIRYVEDSSYPHKYVVIAGGQAIQIAKILLHPRYRHHPFYENDIAIVQLNQNVSLSSYVRTVCLPEENKNLSTPGSKIYVAGWGRTSNKTNNPSPVLLHASFKIQSNDLCRRATSHYFNELVTFCAGDGKGASDTCQGDSGGSTVREVLRDGRLRWVGVGLVSWGEGCGIIGKYGYYTRMEPFLDWIKAITKRNCGNPGRPANGDFSGTEFHEGRELHFHCYSGYRLFGPKSIRCLANGRWNASPPNCKSSCPNPLDIRNGRKIGETYEHGQNVTYTCLGLYTLVGSPSMTCNNGRWILENRYSQWPSCKRSCANPGTPSRGFKTGSHYGHGRRVVYTCERGTIMVGERSSTCYGGKWTNVRPACLKICQDPGSLVNGYKTENRRLYLSGDKVTYRCNPGYDLVGKAELLCNNDGQWNDKAPACYNAAECRNPGGLVNGYVYPEKSKYNFRDRIRYLCKTNYTLIGDSSITCQQDKRWSGNVPRCLDVECKNLGTPRNGVRRPHKNKYVFEDRIDFRCNTNHTLRGDAFIICQSDRTWTGTVPRCLAPCKDPGIPIGGQRYQHSFLHNSIVRFRCNSGWTREGSHTIRCNDGQWDHNSPTCNKDCSRPNKYPSNGGIHGSSSSYRHKAYIRYYCYGGYNRVGQEYVRCLNGTWQNRQPTCRPVECRDPGTLYNGGRHPDKNEYVFKDRIRFQCKTNYTLRGDSSITCQQDKRWSGNVPTCLAPCRDPGIPNHGSRHDHSFLHNARVRFSCRRGWNIEGSQTIRCDNGNWDHPTPQCLDCGSALGMGSGKIPDGNIQASSTRYRYHAKYGRLNGRYAWCSGTAREPYLQIDFGKPYRITGLATQGSGYDHKWVETYTVSSNLAGSSSFNMYREDNQDKIFIGNKDEGTIVRNKLRDPVIARRLRIFPQNKARFSYACMRVEIYGCDLPSDCFMTGSRVVAKWISNPRGGYIYYKAYLTSISRRFWRVELEDENHVRPVQKYLQKYDDLPFVLDVPPKHEEIQVGTRVLAPWWYAYYTSTIKTVRDRNNRYRVRADDGDEKLVTIDQTRLLKSPTFCS